MTFWLAHPIGDMTFVRLHGSHGSLFAWLFCNFRSCFSFNCSFFQAISRYCQWNQRHDGQSKRFLWQALLCAVSQASDLRMQSRAQGGMQGDPAGTAPSSSCGRASRHATPYCRLAARQVHGPFMSMSRSCCPCPLV